MNIKNRSHKYNISRPRSRHGHKYSECKKCLSIMMLICIKQHLSDIWSSAHEKIKDHWGWVGKKKKKTWVNVFKQADKVNTQWNGKKYFSDATNSSGIEEKIIKQINTLISFEIEHRKAIIPKKPSASVEENNREEKTNLKPQEKIHIVDWYKCGYECKLMATFAESFCLSLRLKFRSARGTFCPSVFMNNCPTISHTC